MDRLSELLGHAVQFFYTCWDRIVLSGYIERLQRPENLIYFFQDVVGISIFLTLATALIPYL